jgi:DmsE family decaheme c-type cytochrome
MRTAKRGHWIALLAALGALAPALAAAPAVPPRVVAQSAPAPSPATTVAAAPEKPAEPTYTARGAQSCMKCHDQAPVTDILQSPHAVKGDSHSPFGQHDCESCHGPSEQHASSAPGYGAKRTLPEVSFVGPNVSSVEKRNGVCLGCHETAMRMDWAGSQHQNNNLACVSCHTIHVTKDPVLVKATQPEKCFTCHGEQRAQSFQFSHHPIREGKVVCSDCHNPHGSPGPRLLKETSINETCYTCHADKRGPLLWEHEPVREDCTNCHVPHGSTQARLLKERPPYLCVNCHNTSGHNNLPYSASNLPTGTAQVDARAVSSRMLARGCVNCHSEIHGSNSPSGSFFTR